MKDMTRNQPTPAQEYEAICAADDNHINNASGIESPLDPPPSSSENTIRSVLRIIHDLKSLNRKELESSVSSLQDAIGKLALKL